MFSGANSGNGNSMRSLPVDPTKDTDTTQLADMSHDKAKAIVHLTGATHATEVTAAKQKAIGDGAVDTRAASAGCHQRLGVRMRRMRQQRLRVALLNYSPGKHYRHIVSHIAHHVEVMRYEQIDRRMALLQFAEKIENLRLYRDVQR